MMRWLHQSASSGCSCRYSRIRNIRFGEVQPVFGQVHATQGGRSPGQSSATIRFMSGRVPGRCRGVRSCYSYGRLMSEFSRLVKKVCRYVQSLSLAPEKARTGCAIDRAIDQSTNPFYCMNGATACLRSRRFLFLLMQPADSELSFIQETISRRLTVFCSEIWVKFPVFLF